MLGIAVAEIRAVASAAHEQNRNAVPLAILVNGVDAPVVAVHGVGKHTGFHAHGDQRPVDHHALDFINGPAGHGGVNARHADEPVRVFPDYFHNIVVGHIAHEGIGLPAGNHAHGHAAFLHFLQHEFHVAPLRGRGRGHAEVSAPAGDAILIAEDVHVEKSARGGAEPEVDNHVMPHVF